MKNHIVHEVGPFPMSCHIYKVCSTAPFDIIKTTAKLLKVVKLVKDASEVELVEW